MGKTQKKKKEKIKREKKRGEDRRGWRKFNTENVYEIATARIEELNNSITQ